MAEMMIDCQDLDEFMNCIICLVKNGINFKARAWCLEIELTGGY